MSPPAIPGHVCSTRIYKDRITLSGSRQGFFTVSPPRDLCLNSLPLLGLLCPAG